MEKKINYGFFSETTRINLPSDFLEAIDLYYDHTAMTRLPMAEMAAIKQGNEVGTPAYFAREQGALLVYPHPASGEITLNYYATFTPMVADADESILAATASDLIIYSALTYAADYYLDERSPVFTDKYLGFMTEIQEQANDEETSGTLQSIRPAYNLQRLKMTSKTSFYAQSGATPTEQAAIESSVNTSAASAAAAVISATSAAQSATLATSNIAANQASAAASEASRVASVAAQAASETAETNAETAEAAALVSKNAAASSATASEASKVTSVASASTATSKASEASTSESNAATSASSASTSASTATSKAADSETARAASVVAKDASVVAKNSSVVAKDAAVAAQAAAETAETNAETAETNSASSASGASTSAATATTKASEAAASASSSETSKVASEAAKDAALAALDSFDDRYLGSKSSAPTVDNDGDALASGMLYFNTTTDEMKVYDGSQWLNAYASLSGALLVASNLSDLNNAGTARTNLGLGTAATTAASAYATAAQGTKVDGIEASADVTTASKIQTAGGLLDSELTSIVAVKALNQGVATGDSPDFAALNVNGTATMDGLSVDGNILASTSTGSTFGLVRDDTTTGINSRLGLITFSSTEDNGSTVNTGASITSLSEQNHSTIASGSRLAFNTTPISSTTALQRLNIASNGDISFYEDTGTTAKFFWDASAEKLNLSGAGGLDVTGTATMDGLTVGGAQNSKVAYFDDSSEAGHRQLQFTSSNNGQYWDINSQGTSGGLGGVLTLSTRNTERMRIDSAGNFIVGATSAFDSSSFCVDQSGLGQFRRDGTPLIVRRDGSVGDLISFEDDGADVGSIGVTGTNAYINSQGGTFQIQTLGTGRYGFDVDQIYPQLDNAMNLGHPSYRFDNAYLSGGVYLGGTGAANKLDDYEEGTWQPTYTDDSGNVITNLTNQNGRYVKVGKLVYISGNLRTQSSSDASGLSGNLCIAGLPFTQKATEAAGTVGFFTHESSGSYNAPAQLPRTSPVSSNTTKISIYKYSGSGGRTVRFLVSDLTMSGNSNFMFFQGTYEAA